MKRVLLLTVFALSLIGTTNPAFAGDVLANVQAKLDGIKGMGLLAVVLDEGQLALSTKPLTEDAALMLQDSLIDIDVAGKVPQGVLSDMQEYKEAKAKAEKLAMSVNGVKTIIWLPNKIDDYMAALEQRIKNKAAGGEQNRTPYGSSYYQVKEAVGLLRKFAEAVEVYKQLNGRMPVNKEEISETGYKDSADVKVRILTVEGDVWTAEAKNIHSNLKVPWSSAINGVPKPNR